MTTATGQMLDPTTIERAPQLTRGDATATKAHVATREALLAGGILYAVLIGRSHNDPKEVQ